MDRRHCCPFAELQPQDDYPEELAQHPSGFGFTYSRRGISLEFATSSI